jgi:general secretion pathway protein G
VHRARRAFTLLEIIVVVTIIALLATMVAPRVWRNIGTSKQRVAQAGATEIAKQVRLYCLDNGMSKPPADFDLQVLLTGADPYLDKTSDLTDPWDKPYIIVIPGERNRDFDIVSYGADGIAGGEGEDADVVN